MEFWNREREIEYLKRYIQSEPNAILFVYGPKSSGKSTLLMKVVEELDKESFIYYWYDLREKVITGYDSVLRIFFKEKGWLSRMMEIAPRMFKIPLGVFEFDPKELEKIFKKELDAFEEMRARLEREKEKGKMPVIVFDEIQKLKEVYLNSPQNQRPLVRELFNFFVRLTKVLHLSHVIVMTSDTFFIERVYTDSTLKNTSRFYLVDFFDDNTAIEILKKKFSEDVSREIVEWIGGVPWILREVMESEDPKNTVEEIYEQEKSRLFDFLINHQREDEVRKVLGELIGGKFELSKRNIETVKDLVEAEILFYDPIKVRVRFQTKLDERAAKEILGVV